MSMFLLPGHAHAAILLRVTDDEPRLIVLSIVSDWKTFVAKPGPFISSHDWGKQWVTSGSSCTKDLIGEYVWDVYAINGGTRDFTVQKVILTGKDADDGVFTLDPTAGAAEMIMPGDVIRAGDTSQNRRAQRIVFRPTEEREYSALIVLITETGDTVQNILHGIGIESHVGVESVDFGATEFIGPENPTLTRTMKITSGRSTRPTTITTVRLRYGTDFSLTGAFFKADGATPITLPYTLALDDTIVAQVRFHPLAATPSLKVDTLILFGDFARCDTPKGALVSVVVSHAGVTDNEMNVAAMRCTIEPNPFAAATTITFTLDASGRTSVEIFDAAGTRIVSLADTILDAGRHAFRWDAGDLPSGVYYCRIHAGARSIMQPALLVR